MCTTIATYPSAAAVVRSSTLTPSGKIAAGSVMGGAGSFLDGIGRGTPRMPYSNIEGDKGRIGKSASSVWT
jgi:hypothetical protein